MLRWLTPPAPSLLMLVVLLFACGGSVPCSLGPYSGVIEPISNTCWVFLNRSALPSSSWESSRAICRSEVHLASDLPVLRTPSTLSFALSYLRNCTGVGQPTCRPSSPIPCNGTVWLGLTRMRLHGATWSWIDTDVVAAPSVGLSISFVDPLPSSDAPNSFCGVMSPSGELNFLACNETLHVSAVLCVLNESDRALSSSSNEWLNVIYSHVGSPQEKRYCDFGTQTCPFGLSTCDGISLDPRASCRSHGSCVFSSVSLGPNCSCDSGWCGPRCCRGCSTAWSCGARTSTSAFVCSGHGLCLCPDECSCETGYSGLDCENWTCYSIARTNLSHVCSGNGRCADLDHCECKLSLMLTYDLDDECNYPDPSKYDFYIFYMLATILGLLCGGCFCLLCCAGLCSYICKKVSMARQVRRIVPVRSDGSSACGKGGGTTVPTSSTTCIPTEDPRVLEMMEMASLDPEEEGTEEREDSPGTVEAEGQAQVEGKEGTSQAEGSEGPDAAKDVSAPETPGQTKTPSLGEDSSECVICYEPIGEKRIALVPCGHSRVCPRCCKKCCSPGQKCPICRAKIRARHVIFI